VCILVGVDVSLANSTPGAAKRAFTVPDDIGLAVFPAEPVIFSPDGRYFLVSTDRGLLNQNRAESTLRVFVTQDVRQFLSHSAKTRDPSPIWELSKSTYKNGPIITDVRWLADSSGFAFLAKSASGSEQLCLGDVKAKSVATLTPENQHVTGFDVFDGKHFVYTALSPRYEEQRHAESQATALVGNGRSLESLLYLIDPSMYEAKLNELWSVVGERHIRIKDSSSKQTIHLYSDGSPTLKLSPDGSSVVTVLPISTVPFEWETQFPPLLPGGAYRIRAGRQDLDAFEGSGYVSEYVMIKLSSGEVTPLTGSPIGSSAGWVGAAVADWSTDGKSIVLSNTFLPVDAQRSIANPNRPCIAVVDVVTGGATCLEHSRTDTESGCHYISDVYFDRRTKRLVVVNCYLSDGSKESIAFLGSNDGSWRASFAEKKALQSERSINAVVRQSMNDPPVVVASDNTTGSSKVILDPNPQLKDIALGEVSVFKWKDNSGREREGGLYKPPGYDRNHRYPLVIQTHGFFRHYFLPSGLFTSAFAARELAAGGILVLQVGDCPYSVSPEEGPCNVQEYEGAVKHLVAEGTVDPERIGVVGFSRTCYYVMETLANSALHFQAASITDGITGGYLQYISLVDSRNNAVAHEYDVMMGARPFGEGLREWLKRSPGFNINRVATPLQVVAIGKASVLDIWETYAALRYLGKPVDLIVLGEGTHVLSNPGQRMVSQGGTVDWFRFWLQGYEDPSEEKIEQYRRWEQLCDMQITQNPGQPTFCVHTKAH